jgi:O-antigen ligase
VENLPTTKLLGTYVIFTAIVVSVFVSPWNSIDPVNLPKMTLLGVLAFAGVGALLGTKVNLQLKETKFFNFLFVFFLLALCNSIIASDQNFSAKFYGIPGRNTGFLAYLSLAVFLYLASTVASSDFVKKFIKYLLITGAFLSVYGLAQSFGFDFFDYLNGYGSDVFGTFGNPNFQSAFMGVVAAASATVGIFSREQLRFRFACLALTCVALMNIQLSSWQGYFVFASGTSVSLLIYVFKKGHKKTVAILASVFFVAASVVSLALFNLGPLAFVLYKASLGAREIYWQAAINMIRSHPLTGVGPDGYLDWFRRSRAKEVSEGSNQFVADSAHSIPLDIGASGGLPLLIPYLGLILLAIVSIVIVVRRDKPFDVYFTALVSSWVGYQAQSLISINQLGLGIWGWTSTGLLIGYAWRTEQVKPSKMFKSNKKTRKVSQEIVTSNKSLLVFVTTLSAVLGLVVSTPPYLAAGKYISALRSTNAVALQEKTSLTPSNRRQLFETARIFADNKLFDRSLTVLREATQKYPDYFDLWQLWLAIPTASTEEIIKAKAELRRLDPNNPEWK